MDQEQKQQETTDLDIRVSALQQEYVQQIAQLSNRCATMASELASAQAKLKAFEPKQPEEKKLVES